MKRLSILTILVFLWFTSMPGATESSIRIGLTPVMLDDELHILNSWRNYLEQQLNRPVNFVQRSSYREITDMLLRDDLDVAWVCGLPYVESQDRLNLVATPIYQGAPLYRSYQITSNKQQAKSWSDLEGVTFAYVDPDSNSGYLYPNYAMMRKQLEPDRMFRRSFFAKAHRNAVEAVTEGLADAAAVDGYIWDTLARDNPALVQKTQIVERSAFFGFPPFVARIGFHQQDTVAFRSALVEMSNSSEGREILELLNIDGFMFTAPSLYQSIADMAQTAGRLP